MTDANKGEDSMIEQVRASENARWEGEFNMRVSRISQGAVLSDFPDDEIEAIYRMRDLGFTPQEAVDVCEEVRDVE